MDTEHPVHQAFMLLLERLNKLDVGGPGLFLHLSMVKQYIRQLEERAEELTGYAVAEMEDAQEEKKQMPFGTFTLAKRQKWRYSEAIMPLEEAVKTAKRREEQDGIATQEITKYLIVK